MQECQTRKKKLSGQWETSERQRRMCWPVTIHFIPDFLISCNHTCRRLIQKGAHDIRYSVERHWLERLLGNFALLLEVHKKKASLFFFWLLSCLDASPGITAVILPVKRWRRYLQNWKSRDILMSLNMP